MDEKSARRRDLYLTTLDTQHETDMHAPGGILTRNPSKRAAVDNALYRAPTRIDECIHVILRVFHSKSMCLVRL